MITPLLRKEVPINQESNLRILREPDISEIVSKINEVINYLNTKEREQQQREAQEWM